MFINFIVIRVKILKKYDQIKNGWIDCTTDDMARQEITTYMMTNRATPQNKLVNGQINDDDDDLKRSINI